MPSYSMKLPPAYASANALPSEEGWANATSPLGTTYPWIMWHLQATGHQQGMLGQRKTCAVLQQGMTDNQGIWVGMHGDTWQNKHAA